MTKKTTKKVVKKAAKKSAKETVHVKVFAVDGKIVICPSSSKKAKQFWPTGGDNMGCVVGDSKKMLQVSKEALALMRSVKKNSDCIGDLGWWKCTNKQYAFSWFGAIHRIIDPKYCEAARDFEIFEDQCKIIPNSPPKEVVAGVREKNKLNMWRKPYSTTYHGDE